MTIMPRSSLSRIRLLLALTVVFFLCATSSAYAQRNICYECKAINVADAVNCKDCKLALNLCLDCETANPADKDYCIKCNAPLAEMRILGRIDAKTREDLKLGQSERAKIDKELMKIGYLLEKDPQDAEKLIYKKAMLLHRMDFSSREAETWREFLKQFPDSAKKSTALAYLSVALRKWGFLFYGQKKVEEATALFLEATQANPMNSDAWNWLGRVYMEAGKREEARQAYTKSLEAAPGDQTASHFLRSLKGKAPAKTSPKVSEKAAEKVSEKAPEKAADKAPAEVSEKTPAKVTEKAPTETPVKPADPVENK